MTVPFFKCATCQHPLYDHARRKVPNAGIDEYVGCRRIDCPCDRYLAGDGSPWPGGPAASEQVAA